MLTAFLSQCLFCDTAGLVTVTWLFLFNAQFLVRASCNQREETMKVLHLSTHVAACMWFQGWKRILGGVGCLHFCRLIKAFYWIVLRLRGFIYKYGENVGYSKILYVTLKNDPRSLFHYLWLLGLFFALVFGWEGRGCNCMHMVSWQDASTLKVQELFCFLCNLGKQYKALLPSRK